MPYSCCFRSREIQGLSINHCCEKAPPVSQRGCCFSLVDSDFLAHSHKACPGSGQDILGNPHSNNAAV